MQLPLWARRIGGCVLPCEGVPTTNRRSSGERRIAEKWCRALGHQALRGDQIMEAQLKQYNPNVAKAPSSHCIWERCISIVIRQELPAFPAKTGVLSVDYGQVNRRAGERPRFKELGPQFDWPCSGQLMPGEDFNALQAVHPLCRLFRSNSTRCLRTPSCPAGKQMTALVQHESYGHSFHSIRSQVL